jgi:hypothetical protein
MGRNGFQMSTFPSWISWQMNDIVVRVPLLFAICFIVCQTLLVHALDPFCIVSVYELNFHLSCGSCPVPVNVKILFITILFKITAT